MPLLTDKAKGGPAFPTTVHPNSSDGHDGMMTGMSLRDWFAGQAVGGLIAAGFDMADAVRCAFATADAMIAERSK